METEKMGEKLMEFKKKNNDYSFSEIYAIFRLKICPCFGFLFGYLVWLCVWWSLLKTMLHESFIIELLCPYYQFVEGSFSSPNPEPLENDNTHL